MGHLGDSTAITTVQDKEVVLTGSDGQTFKMKVADLAEAVRQVMSVATSEKNGLMGKDGFFSGSSTCSDANSAINSGTYLTSNVTINAGRGAWGTLIVFKSHYTVQLQIIAASIPEFYFRMFAGDGWIKWRQISFT